MLGFGWSAHALSKIIETDLFSVTFISPRPFFIFTPMLAATAVGSVEYRSLLEPVRIANPLVNYIQGEVSDVFPHDKKVQVKTSLRETDPIFDVSYDYLVYAVGSRVGDFGIKGVREYCCFIKEIEDVRLLKAKLLQIFETVLLPGTSQSEIDRLLTFVVVGGGPTGIEFIGELADFIEDKVAKFYPELLKSVKIVLLNAASTILSAFDTALRTNALNTILSLGVDVRLNSYVTEVSNDSITYVTKEKDGSITQTLKYGLCVWAGGTACRPISQVLADKLGPEQVASVKKSGRLQVDPWLRMRGNLPSGSILGMGDCVCTNGLDNSTGIMGEPVLPQTAQVAAQQGAYVAHLLNRQYNLTAPIPSVGENIWTTNPLTLLRVRGNLNAQPFAFLNLGLLAYIGIWLLISIRNY